MLNKLIQKKNSIRITGISFSLTKRIFPEFIPIVCNEYTNLISLTKNVLVFLKIISMKKISNRFVL